MAENKISITRAVIPIAFFFALLIFGLFIYPVFIKKPMLPLEILILISLCFSSIYLLRLGYSWEKIEAHITKKVGEAVPVLMILFSIGVLIGSWIVSGTIPMLIYHGISFIDPTWIYVFSFLICIVFSLLTGTSWGSAGTIGVVMIGIAQVYNADLAITAAAIVGGSFFGDKLSPLSDTTNIASLATEIPLFDHIHAMLYTTVPAAIIAVIFYTFFTPEVIALNDSGNALGTVKATLHDLENIFNFNGFLLLPLLVVFYGSIAKKPIVLTLLGSAWVAMVLALIFQDFGFANIFTALKSGFNISMSDATVSEGSNVLAILNRGGLYNLIEGIVVSILVFAFIGTLDVIDAINVCLKGIMTKIKKQSWLIITTISATLVTNITTSNQYATSFIIGSAFKDKFDKMGINRKVLSRSIEDAGTMMENLFPWTPSGIFMTMTLGVSPLLYAPYQVMSLANIVIAYFFALTGIACFKNIKKSNEE